jgi:hypothetical protein
MLSILAIFQIGGDERSGFPLRRHRFWAFVLFTVASLPRHSRKLFGGVGWNKRTGRLAPLRRNGVVILAWHGYVAAIGTRPTNLQNFRMDPEMAGMDFRNGCTAQR